MIVLNNVAAASLGESAMDRLTQYVRDLGGSLLIVGGDQSFAAGGYLGHCAGIALAAEQRAA